MDDYRTQPPPPPVAGDAKHGPTEGSRPPPPSLQIASEDVRDRPGDSFPRPPPAPITDGSGGDEPDGFYPPLSLSPSPIPAESKHGQPVESEHDEPAGSRSQPPSPLVAGEPKRDQVDGTLPQLPLPLGKGESEPDQPDGSSSQPLPSQVAGESEADQPDDSSPPPLSPQVAGKPEPDQPDDSLLQPSPPSMPADSGGSTMYDIERIVRWRKRGDRAEFEVKWAGYADAHNTWEPHRNLTLFGAEAKALFLNFVNGADDKQLRRLLPRTCGGTGRHKRRRIG